MAYSHDRIADTDNTLSRDSDWFRINQSKSGTPISQQLAFDQRPAAEHVSRNDPLRTPPNAYQLAVERAAALVSPAAPLVIPAGLVLDMHEDVPVTRIAMHGGPGPGERFMQPKRRLAPIKFNCGDVCAAPKLDRPRPTAVFRPTQFHAVAGQRIAQGVADAAALAEVREAARLRGK